MVIAETVSANQNVLRGKRRCCLTHATLLQPNRQLVVANVIQSEMKQLHTLKISKVET
jgi:hypothetical protein